MKAIVLCLCLASIIASAETLYLAAGPWGGDGTREHPLRIPSAEAFDAVLVEVGRNASWDTIDLAPGEYLTQGVWRFPVPTAGAAKEYSTMVRPLHLRGAGMLRTTIRLAPDAVTETNGKDRPDLCVLRFGRPWVNNGGPFTLEDLTIDGNQQAFPTNRVVTGGAVFHANNVTVRRVRVINLRGSFELHQEAFGILINNFDAGPYAGPDGNNRVIDCVVESNGDVEEYVSPFYVSVRDRGRPLIQSEIVGCRTIGSGKKPTRIGVSVQSATVVDRFHAHNVVHAIYNDVGPVRDVIVRHSRFTSLAYSGPWFVVDAPKDRILVERCEFEFLPYPADREWIGLTVWDALGSGAAASDITVRDCVFRGQGTRPFTEAAIKSALVGTNAVRLLDNVMPSDSRRTTNLVGVISSQ